MAERDREIWFMKNIYIEGIQGMGKSTLVNCLSNAIPELHVCREGGLFTNRFSMVYMDVRAGI